MVMVLLVVVLVLGLGYTWYKESKKAKKSALDDFYGEFRYKDRFID